WKPVCQYEDNGTGSKILSIDAADLNKDGKAKLFITSYNAAFERVETTILECKDKNFEKVATIPYMTRVFQDVDGSVKMGAQHLIDDPTFPSGAVYTLAFKDGKYTADKPVKARRVEWVYGFALVRDTAGDSFPLFTTKSDHLRVQFKK